MRRIHGSAVVAASVALFAAAQAQTAADQHFTLVTFNDVYEIQPVDGGASGGAARVATLVKQWRAADPNTLVLFGGDLLSPSVMSSSFQGEQMIAALNSIGVDFATLGNHELDFGLPTLKTRIGESKFKWLAANIAEGATGSAIPGTAPDAIVNLGGVKVGLFGDAYDFNDILKDKTAVKFADPIATAKAEVKKLKDAGAQFIIAITHQEHKDDCALSAAVPDLNLIVGGHDHAAMFDTQCGNAPYVKATSDWRNVWKLDVTVPAKGKPVISYALVPVTAAVADDAATAAVVKAYADKLDASLDQVVGSSTVELDAVQKDVRGKETNYGNLIADAMRAEAGADVAITNGGGIRTDRLYPAGQITKRAVYGVLPFGNKVVAMRASGKVIRAALENGVSQMENGAGRFPQVSGLTFTVDPSKPAGSRVSDVMVNGKPLDDAATYTVATNDYMLGGGDGYTMFVGLPTLVEADEGALIAEVVSSYIQKLGTVSPKVEGRIKILGR